MTEISIWRKIWILSSYGFAHMIIDFVCASTIFSIYINNLVDTETFIKIVLLYNCLAFGLQILFWRLADKFQESTSLTIIWCILVGLWSVLFFNHPIIATISVWLWNALFHVWWWIVSISTNPWKADVCWIFVAPGALWLFLWTLLWKSWNFLAREWIIATVTAIIWIIISSHNFNAHHIINNFSPTLEKEKLNRKTPAIIIISLLILSIIIRSFIWFIVWYSRKTWWLLIAFTLCIVFGKFFGWIVADKFGWMRTWISSLLLSLPCLIFGEKFRILWMIGIFLFNITMSIALSALIQAFPKRQWFAFWLLCLALLIWALPSLLWITFTWSENILIFYLILLSTGALFLALHSLNIKK